MSTRHVDDAPQRGDELHGSQVGGEDVGVAHRCNGALLPPPLLVTQVEDEDGGREKEEGLGDDVGSGDDGSSSGVRAVEYILQG